MEGRRSSGREMRGSHTCTLGSWARCGAYPHSLPRLKQEERLYSRRPPLSDASPKVQKGAGKVLLALETWLRNKSLRTHNASTTKFPSENRWEVYEILQFGLHRAGPSDGQMYLQGRGRSHTMQRKVQNFGGQTATICRRTMTICVWRKRERNTGPFSAFNIKYTWRSCMVSNQFCLEDTNGESSNTKTSL